jgi:diacylglycerol kinase (ATP)
MIMKKKPNHIFSGNGFQRFVFALNGLAGLLRSEQNARIHLVITFIVITLGFLFGINRTEWIAIIICIGMVIAAEAMNTAIEKLADVVSPEKNDRIRIVKDLSAGSVFLLAIMAVVTGIIIFLPYCIQAGRQIL